MIFQQTSLLKARCLQGGWVPMFAVATHMDEF